MSLVPQTRNAPKATTYKWFEVTRRGTLRSPVVNTSYPYKRRQWSDYRKKVEMCSTGWHVWNTLKTAKNNRHQYWRDRMQLWQVEIENPHNADSEWQDERPAKPSDFKGNKKLVGTRIRLIRLIIDETKPYGHPLNP